MITVTREQLYHRFLQKQEDIIKQLQIDIEKVHSEVIRQNELGKTKITIAYNSNTNDDAYLDLLVKKTKEIFIDSNVSIHMNEITIDWTFPIQSTSF